MIKYHPVNERIKRQYYRFLKDAKGYSEATIDASAMALSRFEIYTRHRDFKAFHYEQAIGFKKHLAAQKNHQTGKALSKATLHATLLQLRRFFQWLSLQTGYKSRLQYADAEYFNLSEKDTRIATAKREQKFPTLEQVKHVIKLMPAETEIERRDRALIAFTLLTGARDSALASMQLKHVDLVSNCVNQDAREVRTKFSKTFSTDFFPVGEEIHGIVTDWVMFLRDQKLWGNDDPLFPATKIALGQEKQFIAAGLATKHWSNSTPIRRIFREAFTRAGLPYFNPHSLRDTLVQLGEKICTTPEEFKAWSQNLGHEKVMTTFFSYGNVGSQRQREIIRNLARPKTEICDEANTIINGLFQKMVASGVAIVKQ